LKDLILLTILFTCVTTAQNNEWKIFNTSNSPLPTNTILCLNIDIFNNIWIGTASGLVKKSNDDWVIYNQSNSDIPVDVISYIQSDKNGIVWLTGSDNGYPKGLIKFDGTNWTIFDTLNSPLPSVVIESIAIDSLNNKWLLPVYNPTTTYLTKFDGNSVWNTYPGYYNFVAFNCDQVTSDPFNNIWTATKYYIAKFDGQNYSFFNSSQPMGNYITAVRIDLLNNIWIAGGLAGWGGLTKFDGLNFTYYFNIPAITLANDQQNNIWISSQSDPFSSPGELVKFDGVTWTYYTPQNSPLPDNDYIIGIRLDKYDNLWLGLYINFEDSLRGGLVQFREGGIITPIELKNFTAELSGNDVFLNWTTSTETNNSGFEILRTTKENDWNKIGFVPGHGTTTEPQFYSYVDESLHSGRYQYRLKQIDFDGSFEYSKIIEVEIGSPTIFSLEQNYPNPFNPTTKIKYTIPTPPVSSPLVKGRTKEGFVTLKVYDVLGNEVATLVNEEKPAGECEVEFDGSEFPSGVYFYQLSAGDFIKTQKMVLMK